MGGDRASGRGLLAVAAVVAILGAPADVRGATDSALLCGRCHDPEAAQAATTGGHAAGVDCVDCHEDRRPGRFARRHRTITTCLTHHVGPTRHPPVPAKRAGRGVQRNCLACHDPHGSTNAHLVRTVLPTDRFHQRAVQFTNEGGAVPGSFADPTTPGRGLCEVCHRHTDFYRASGHGKAHFSESCILCHEHDAGFLPVVAEKNCPVCHAAEAARFSRSSLHHATFGACTPCHAERAVTPGPGHRATPACTDCHAGLATHAPPGHPAFACTQCHDPHGTDDARLVLDAITTPQGASRAVHFDGNLLGKVDGSFASVSAPGSGICEVCHSTTRFYRGDGTGDPHFTFSCLPCHLHGAGFAPR